MLWTMAHRCTVGNTKVVADLRSATRAPGLRANIDEGAHTLLVPAPSSLDSCVSANPAQPTTMANNRDYYVRIENDSP